MTLKKILQQLHQEFSACLSSPFEFRGETSLKVLDPLKIAEIAGYMKGELGFDYLIDISSVDHYGEDPRFEVVYEVYGYGHHNHLRLKTRLSEEKPELPSVVGVWKTADWHEREVYDMMGILFQGHPDLRRILMWEGYPYYPLRKDFPLAGKETALPEIAFSAPAPMEGGPFVTPSGTRNAEEREPRAKGPELS